MSLKKGGKDVFFLKHKCLASKVRPSQHVSVLFTSFQKRRKKEAASRKNALIALDTSEIMFILDLEISHLKWKLEV